MSYSSISGSATKIGSSNWKNVANQQIVATIDPDLGLYVFKGELGMSSGFLVTGSVQISGSGAGGGPDGTLLRVEGGGSGRDIDGQTALYVQHSGGFGRVGIGTANPKVELDISLNSVGDPNNFAPDTGGGEVVHFGNSTLTVPGALYFLNDTSSWNSASADATGSGHHQLLGLAMGTNSQNDGMLIRGWLNATTFYTGTFMPGFPVYIHSGTAGFMSASAPNGDNSYARIVGYGSANGNLIYFNPSSNWIELTGS